MCGLDFRGTISYATLVNQYEMVPRKSNPHISNVIIVTTVAYTWFEFHLVNTWLYVTFK